MSQRKIKFNPAVSSSSSARDKFLDSYISTKHSNIPVNLVSTNLENVNTTNDR